MPNIRQPAFARAGSFAPSCPNECIENVLAYVPLKQRFDIATDLRFLYVQKQCLGTLEWTTVVHASRKGQCDLLDVWKHMAVAVFGPNEAGALSRKLSWDDCEDAIDMASAYARIHVLAWWKKNRLFLSSSNLIPWVIRPSKQSIVSAATNGHIIVLQWWEDHAVDTDMTPPLPALVISTAAEYGQVAVLEWYVQTYGYRRKSQRCYDRAIGRAAYRGHIPVLEWFLRTLPFLFSFSAVQCCFKMASVGGYVETLQWLKDHKLPVEKAHYTMVSTRHKALEHAYRFKHVNVLQWWSLCCAE